MIQQMLIKHQLYESPCAKGCTKLFGRFNSIQIILDIISSKSIQYSQENITFPKVIIIIIIISSAY